MGWLDTLLDALFAAISRFSRKTPPAPVHADPFGRNHLPDLEGTCIYCGQERASARQACPGPSDDASTPTVPDRPSVRR